MDKNTWALEVARKHFEDFMRAVLRYTALYGAPNSTVEEDVQPDIILPPPGEGRVEEK